MSAQRIKISFRIPPTRKVRVVYFRSNTPPDIAVRNGETAYSAVIDRPSSMDSLERTMVLQKRVPLSSVHRLEPVSDASARR